MGIVLINKNASIPTRASKGSAELDLYSSIDVNIEVSSIKKVNTGIFYISSRKFLWFYKR